MPTRPPKEGPISLAQPDDIGGVIAFLASDDARWITGDTIHVDGGSKLWAYSREEDEALKLYHAPASPNSRRVRMFLAEKDISPQLVAVDLAAGEQHGEAYRAINPRRVVPTVVLVNGTAIGEVLAIWRFLEEAYPAVPLLGTTPKDKTLVTMSEQRAEFEGFAAVMEGVRNAAPRLGRAIAGPHDYAQTPALVERNKLRVTNFYSDIEARLAKAPFVAGAHFSAADITTLVTIDFATRASFAIATSPAVGYCVRTGAGCWYDREPERLEPGQPERTVLVDDAYIEAQAPTVRDRLARAGVRLAGLLNNSLDPHDK